MNILSLELHNFLSHKHTKFDFSKSDIYNILGHNGAGKSSISDSITWCLFGKSRCSGSGDELIHNTENEIKVTVELESNSIKYKVMRFKERNQPTKLTVEEL